MKMHYRVRIDVEEFNIETREGKILESPAHLVVEVANLEFAETVAGVVMVKAREAVRTLTQLNRVRGINREHVELIRELREWVAQQGDWTASCLDKADELLEKERKKERG